MIEEAQELYAAPPADFVARRNALVRELKAAGRSDNAKAVGTLRRPRLSEFTLNAAVRTDDSLGPRFATAVADADLWPNQRRSVAVVPTRCDGGHA